MNGTRLAAVLGYSDALDELYPACAARLARAAEEARPGNALLLSGWTAARRRQGRTR